MFIFLLLIIILCLLNFKLSSRGFHPDYMSMEKTTSIKGIFLLLVFSSHINSYISFNDILDLPLITINKKLGQLIVTMFLFYSGYGIYESIKRKKDSYIKKFPKERILKLLVNFGLAVLLFLLANLLIGRHYDIKTILLSFIGWKSLGNSNWYIFCILIMYVITYISFKVFEDKHMQAIIGVTILSVLYACFMSQYKESWWYNTALCYVAGMWFSYFRTKIEKVILKNNKIYLFYLTILLLLFYVLRNYRNDIVIYELWAVTFSLITVMVTLKASINNKILNWIGKNLFTLYILQRLPMILLKHYNINLYGSNMYLILSFISTIIISILFTLLLNRLDYLYSAKWISSLKSKS